MGSVFLKFLVGAAIGLAVGLLSEPLAPTVMNDPGWDRWGSLVILVLGASWGAAIGLLDGLARGGRTWVLRGLGLGALLGAIGAPLGANIGQGLSTGIFGPSWTLTAPLPVQMLARATLFICIGACVGAAIGGSSLNPKKLIQGLIGGLVGGAIAGLLFDPIGAALGSTILSMRGQTTGEVGGPSRVIGWIVLGSMIALMIGLVDRIARRAWLRLDLGRNEGKEWSLDAATNFIGRGEGCHVPLRGDYNIAPVHASIARQGNAWVLTDTGSPIGTFVNGHRIAQAAVRAGDMIQIGSFALRFMEKGEAIPYQQGGFAPPPGQMPGQPYGQPMPGHMPAQPYPQPGPINQPYGQPSMGGQPTVAFPAQAPQGQPTVAFPAAQAGPTLVAMDGPFSGRRFPVGQGLEIGREASGIALSGDTNASRRHAAVVMGPQGLMVNDLGSTNGTFVDGQRVTNAALRPGSLLRIGNTTFRVE